MEDTNENPILEELHNWANERFRTRAATMPSNIKLNNYSRTQNDIARPVRKISREGPSMRRRLSIPQTQELPQNADTPLSGYSSNQTLSEADFSMDAELLTKKIEHLEKERDFCLSKLRNIEDLCARFGEMGKDEKQAKIPIRKIIAIIYALDEGFNELNEFSSPQKIASRQPSILEHDDSFDETFDPSASPNAPSPRKISPPHNHFKFSNIPTENDVKNVGDILMATPIIEPDESENVID